MKFEKTVKTFKKNNPPIFIILIFSLLLILTNFLVQWQIKIWNIVVTVGLLVYPLTFLVTDFVNEIHGKKVSRNLVFIALVFSIIPSVFISTLQITIASLLAYLTAQIHDIWSFNWWKEKTNGRFLWLRNNASTIVSQLLDTIIFATVAFYGVLPFEIILSIIISEYFLKLMYAIGDTIPLYWLVKYARG